MFSKQLLGNMKLQKLASLALIDGQVGTLLQETMAGAPHVLCQGLGEAKYAGAQLLLRMLSGRATSSSSGEGRTGLVKRISLPPFWFWRYKKKTKIYERYHIGGFWFWYMFTNSSEGIMLWAGSVREGFTEEQKLSKEEGKAICEVAWPECQAERYKTRRRPSFLLGTRANQRGPPSLSFHYCKPSILDYIPILKSGWLSYTYGELPIKMPNLRTLRSFAKHPKWFLKYSEVREAVK